MRRAAAACILLCTLAGCAAGIKQELRALGALPSDQTSKYLAQFSRSTATEKIYDQFETKALIRVTRFTPAFLDAYLDERKAFMNEGHFGQLAERERAVIAKNLKFFVSFYTPEPDHADLEKPGSVWLVYIERSGGRKLYPVSIRKSKEDYTVLSHFFPTLDPWSVPYIAVFANAEGDKPVIAAGEEYKLIFKSVIGTAAFTFKHD